MLRTTTLSAVLFVMAYGCSHDPAARPDAGAPRDEAPAVAAAAPVDEAEARIDAGAPGAASAPDEDRPRYAPWRVTVGRPSVRGGGTKAGWFPSMARRQGRGLDRCYNQTLKAAPAAAGILSVRMGFDRSDKPKTVEVIGDTVGRPEFAACVAEDIRSWSGFLHLYEGPMTLMFPITFGLEPVLGPRDNPNPYWPPHRCPSAGGGGTARLSVTSPSTEIITAFSKREFLAAYSPQEPAIGRCYNELLASERDALDPVAKSGVWRIGAEIAPTGELRAVRVTAQCALAGRPKLEACVLEAIRAVRFPAFEGSPIPIEFRVDFHYECDYPFGSRDRADTVQPEPWDEPNESVGE